MNTYYLIRHGQDYDNLNSVLNGHRNMTLTETGINQAIESGKKIKELNLSIDAVISSPLNRAFVTASIVSAINNFPTPIIDDKLIERDFGMMTGKKQSEIVALCSPEIITTGTITYFLSPQGSETFPDLIVRANILLSELELKYIDKKIMLVSHGDFGKMFYTAYYKLDWKNVLADFHFGNSELLLLDPNTNPDNAKLVQIKQHNL